MNRAETKGYGFCSFICDLRDYDTTPVAEHLIVTDFVISDEFPDTPVCVAIAVAVAVFPLLLEETLVIRHVEA